MAKVVGVHFRNAGKVYYFNPKELELKMMDRVIVDTERGQEIGTVMTDPRDIDEEKLNSPLRNVLRKATEDDEERNRRNSEKEDEAFKKCKELIMKHELDMKLVGAEYTFDNGKLLFYFTSENRVDFRELVKDLASHFRTRIELRQIGVRDETKIMGGIGICGREVCCKSYLSDFVPVSIKMAKNQSLSLNPTKISGLCGRLLCCLKNEDETYQYLNSRMPKLMDEVLTSDGIKGEVQSMNVLKQQVRVVYEENGTREARDYPVEEITVTGHKKKGQPQKQNKEDKEAEKAAEALEAAEKKDEKSGENGGDKKPHKKHKNKKKKKTPNNGENRANTENKGEKQDS